MRKNPSRTSHNFNGKQLEVTVAERVHELKFVLKDAIEDLKETIHGTGRLTSESLNPRLRRAPRTDSRED